MTVRIRRIGVVVPAHNEEERIGRCLESLDNAAREVQVPVRVIVVLDDCSDRTEEVCANFQVETVVLRARCVGKARRVGIAELLREETEPETVWLANTDADTVSPPGWLLDQLQLANTGVDVIAGVVTLSGSGSPSPLHQVFESHYHRRLATDRSHPHVHGANLALRASAYLQVGGFPPVHVHEDRRLMQRLRGNHGTVIACSTRITVETSDRLVGRCVNGFADTLAGWKTGGIAATSTMPVSASSD